MHVYSSWPVLVGEPFVAPDVLAGARIKPGNKAAVAHAARLTVRSGAW